MTFTAQEVKTTNSRVGWSRAAFELPTWEDAEELIGEVEREGPLPRGCPHLSNPAYMIDQIHH